jgi:hypothetical protein
MIYVVFSIYSSTIFGMHLAPPKGVTSGVSKPDLTWQTTYRFSRRRFYAIPESSLLIHHSMRCLQAVSTIIQAYFTHETISTGRSDKYASYATGNDAPYVTVTTSIELPPSEANSQNITYAYYNGLHASYATGNDASSATGSDASYATATASTEIPSSDAASQGIPYAQTQAAHTVVNTLSLQSTDEELGNRRVRMRQELVEAGLDRPTQDVRRQWYDSGESEQRIDLVMGIW